jgi:glucose-6-phosphate isomerase
MWSPISLPAILELGEKFIEFLKGGSLADTQFLNDEKYQKFLKTLSFSDIWYNNFVNKGLEFYYLQLENEVLYRLCSTT